jgi:hypothetical protein
VLVAGVVVESRGATRDQPVGDVDGPRDADIAFVPVRLARSRAGWRVRMAGLRRSARAYGVGAQGLCPAHAGQNRELDADDLRALSKAQVILCVVSCRPPDGRSVGERVADEPVDHIRGVADGKPVAGAEAVRDLAGSGATSPMACRTNVERAPGPHLGGDPDRLHDLLGACSFAASELGVSGDAVGALSHVCYRHSDQLLGLLLKCPLGKTARLKFSKAALISGASCLRRVAISGVAAGYMRSVITDLPFRPRWPAKPQLSRVPRCCPG